MAVEPLSDMLSCIKVVHHWQQFLHSRGKRVLMDDDAPGIRNTANTHRGKRMLMHTAYGWAEGDSLCVLFSVTRH